MPENLKAWINRIHENISQVHVLPNWYNNIININPMGIVRGVIKMRLCASTLAGLTIFVLIYATPNPSHAEDCALELSKCKSNCSFKQQSKNVGVLLSMALIKGAREKKFDAYAQSQVDIISANGNCNMDCTDEFTSCIHSQSTTGNKKGCLRVDKRKGSSRDAAINICTFPIAAWYCDTGGRAELCDLANLDSHLINSKWGALNWVSINSENEMDDFLVCAETAGMPVYSDIHNRNICGKIE